MAKRKGQAMTDDETVLRTTYDAGYRQCAEDAIKKLEPIRYRRIRIGEFKVFADWIWGVALGLIAPVAPTPKVAPFEPDENAQVEGSDARAPD